MTLQEYLLVQLGEEASEVAHACGKAARFGLRDDYKGKNDQQRVVEELNDLFALVELLQTHNILPLATYDKQQVVVKKEKVRKWMEHAKSLGTLEI
jgi:NTP pyrophosphatase (non-canonical NTP hydrolase)